MRRQAPFKLLLVITFCQNQTLVLNVSAIWNYSSKYILVSLLKNLFLYKFQSIVREFLMFWEKTLKAPEK